MLQHLERQRLLVCTGSYRVSEGPAWQRRKGGSALLNLPLKGGVRGLQLPPVLLGRLMTLMRGPSLLQSTDASLLRSFKGSLGLHAGTLMLQVPKVNGNL